jgi:NAD(P)-dependent dehydrogenase (short-subunit alcohol dehydrogenase family)
MTHLLADKVALVTGAAGSIGLTTVRRFLDEGAKVAMVDLNADALSRALDSLTPAERARVITIAADVSDEADSARYAAETFATFGKIDILFSNAGNDGPLKLVQDYPIDMFDLIQRVHVRGTFLALRNVVPHLPHGGRIIVTASVVGVTGVPGNIAYVSAKHALVGMVRGVGKELARRGITVNAVCPGPVDNDFMRKAERSMSILLGRDAGEMFDREKIPMGRHVTPLEVAEAVLFLASPHAGGTTCSCVMVDGGMHD